MFCRKIVLTVPSNGATISPESGTNPIPSPIIFSEKTLSGTSDNGIIHHVQVRKFLFLQYLPHVQDHLTLLHQLLFHLVL